MRSQLVTQDGRKRFGTPLTGTEVTDKFPSSVIRSGVTEQSEPDVSKKRRALIFRGQWFL